MKTDIYSRLDILKKNISEMELYVKTVIRGRSYLVQELSKRGFEAVDSDTNFILVKFPEGSNIVTRLLAKGMLVRRPFTQPFMQGWTRITVGDITDMNKLLAVLGKSQ